MLNLYHNHIRLLSLLADEVEYNDKFNFIEEIENLLKGKNVRLKKNNSIGYIQMVRSNGRGLVFLCQFSAYRWCDTYELELC